MGAAVRLVLPEVKLERCTVHLTRNILAKAPWRLRGRPGKEVSQLFEAPSRAEARKRLEALRSGLGAQVPEAMACLDEGFLAARSFYDFPRQHRRRIRTTNGLERLHGEVKRRLRAVGAFPDRTSALRLVTAVTLAATSIWDDPQYPDVSLLTTEATKAA